jgi:8-oxo-dGTP pyrophosphatase MutT (NUDIX family)
VPEDPRELLNVYDATGRVVGSHTRGEAGRNGLAVGAINVLLVDVRGRVLLQKRQADRENGGRWDKSVGGHVDAGEGFDATAVRETGEELFGDGRSPLVHLVAEPSTFAAVVASRDLEREVVFRRAALHLNLRDVRLSPGRGLRNVVYHVAAYVGRTDIPIAGFRPDQRELDGLDYASAADVDAMLVRGELAPNMAFLWLIHGLELLGLAAPA